MKIENEGSARFRVDSGVFYNPQMEELRSMSVTFLKAATVKGKRILDSTAATGIRAIRYALEAKGTDITLLDINKKAADNARKNVRLNGLKFKVLNDSIQKFANTHEGSFEIIDLDPFGSPAPDLYDLMKISWDGTVLMVTATDTAVLCGAHGPACIKIYGAKPLHNEMCKEAGIRILIGYVARIAAQFNFGIVPLLSVSDRHYMRVFIRLEFGAAKAVESVKGTGIGAFCRKCYGFGFAAGAAPLISPACDRCDERMEPFGPLWLRRLYDKKLTSKMLDIKETKLLRTINDEFDSLMFYSIPRITSSLGLGSVSHYSVIGKLKERGRKATETQFDSDGVKTDASAEEVIGAVKAVHSSMASELTTRQSRDY
jgi:tRNA (guanine26-N2/guanine27-N2)-dimethyltransferase